jgi:hypothetical protein
VRGAVVLVLAIVSTTATAEASHYIYMNPCRGGCVVQGGADDAKNHVSSIPAPGTYAVGEFQDANGQTLSSGSPMAAAEWAAVTQCMREVFSPYGVTLTEDVNAIPAGQTYTELVIAGRPEELGLSNALGITPAVQSCTPPENTMVFAFANAHPPLEFGVCWTAAFEIGYFTGLKSVDSPPADVMSSRFDVGGERFFRDEDATCADGPCRCTTKQNSHQHLLSLYGPGTSIVPPPTVSILLPANGATISADDVVQVSAGSKRGVERISLSLNNHVWTSIPGTDFGINGQPNPATYTLAIPNGVPDSIIDIVVTAYDDLGAKTDSATVTVTKGAAGGCTSADTCITGQQCLSGRCYFVMSECPDGQQPSTQGICGEDFGGCCDATSDAPALQLGASVFLLAVITRRRR